MKRSKRFGDRTAAAWLLAAPALLGLAVFILAPFLVSLAFAFTNLRLGSPLPLEFVGLKQFRRIFENPDFLRALCNNLQFALAIVPMQTALALGLALLLNLGLKGTVAFRTLFFMPVVFPMSLVSVIWILIYAPGPEGPMNAFLGGATFGSWRPVD
ncbi:MAG: sugar ABC transporter permease, partial [Gammaproteobacteria bacterium]